MQKANVNGISLAFEDSGDAGKPVGLMVHGFALDHRMWDPQVEAISRRFRVVAPDLRAFGATEPGPPGALTMSQHADDLAGLLDHLGIVEPVLFVGLSMGGYTAFEFWRRHKSRVRAMILADTKATHDDATRREYREIMARQADELRSPAPALELMWPHLCSPTRSLDSDVPQRLKSMMAEQSSRAIADGQRGMAARMDSVPLLAGMDIPVLVIVGEDDVLTPPDESRLMARGLPHASLEIIKGSGHMSNMEAPEDFNSAMLEWIARP